MLRAVAANPQMNERARKELFILHLISIFPSEEHRSRLRDLAAGAERFVATSPSSESGSTSGFVDTLNGRLFIEFKADLLSTPSKRTAETELRRYVASLWTSEGPHSSFCCIATDVLRWQVWRPVPSERPPDGQYNADMVRLEDVETLDVSELNEEGAHHLVLLLKRVLIEDSLMSLSAENLRRDFGFDSAQYALLAPDLRDIILGARSEP